MPGLTKNQLAELRSLYTRHGRRKSDRCVCEGVRACGELFTRRPDLVLYTIATAKVRQKMTVPEPCTVVAEDEINQLSGTITSQGIIVVAKVPALSLSPVKDDFILALDRIGDPGNFGTMVRTALSAGLSQVWYTKGSVDPYSDKVVRSALGAQFALALREFESLEELQKQAAQIGYKQVCVSTPHGGENCFSAAGLFDHTVVVIGSEGDGAAELAQKRDIMIPMPGGFESLNAAQAATILIFEYVRRKTGGQGA